jgi:hypothetical protein
VYFFVLRAEIATIFGPNVIAISARNTKVYKICELCNAIFSAFYNISQPNFAILHILVCSFSGNIYFWQDKKIVYNGNCLFVMLRCCMFQEIGFTHMRIVEGVNSLLQMSGLLARLCMKTAAEETWRVQIWVLGWRYYNKLVRYIKQSINQTYVVLIAWQTAFAGFVAGLWNPWKSLNLNAGL